MTTSTKFDDIEILRNPEIAETKLREAIDQVVLTDDAEDFLLLLRKLTKVQGGMSALSNRVSINRQNLYRTFASTGNPKFKSLAAILRGLGYKLSIERLPTTLKEEAVREKEAEAA
jgi:probable addiction module antidote protein